MLYNFFIFSFVFFCGIFLTAQENNIPPKKKKTLEERSLFSKERLKYDFNLQRNPTTNTIPREVKFHELSQSQFLMKKKLEKIASNSWNLQERISENIYEFRGPSNLGGRTRALAIDISDTTGNTLLAGGVSGGMFRSTDGGGSWTRVSSTSDIHNVTCIAQDPRPGFQNIWYYGTGEWVGNSAFLGSTPYYGQGIWKSIDGGMTWSQLSNFVTNDFALFDSFFDSVMNIVVDPTSGDLLAAHAGRISRLSGTTITTLVSANQTGWTDVAVTSTGRVYATIEGSSTSNGVYTSATGNAPFTRIAQNNLPTGWASVGRTILGVSESNENIMYVLYDNGKTSVVRDPNTNAIISTDVEADLWRYDLSIDSWTNFTSKLPDEPGGDAVGNDPFSIQSGYDLEIAVKPDDENFVIIGGTNAYKIENINTESTFTRIGGYANNINFSRYSVGGVEHHPDMHSFVFNPFDNNQLFSGTDGGVYRTDDITAGSVSWNDLNTNYNTYQFYHIAIDPLDGSDLVMGGAQDNGTAASGGSYPAGTNFQRIIGGDGVAVELSQHNGNLNYFMGFQFGDIFRLPEGQPFSNNLRPSDRSHFVTYFYLDRDNNENLYYAGINELFRTTNSSTVTAGTWDDLGARTDFETSDDSGGNAITYMQASNGVYNASSFLLVGYQGGHLLKLNDPKNIANLDAAINITPSGATVDNPTTNNANEGAYVSSISIHPTDNNIALVTYSNYGVNNIYLTKDLTSANPTWTLVERNLNVHSIRSSMITQVNGQTQYYIGTARGLYFSLDPETEDWELESPTLIGLAIISSLKYRQSDGRLLIGTHGNGMYQTTVDEVLAINENQSNQRKISLYPNPADSIVYLQDSNNSEFEDYIIFNTIGEKVSYGKIQNQSINVQNLVSGIYFVKIINSKNESELLKLIKK